jgi:hypothetical protein
VTMFGFSFASKSPSDEHCSIGTKSKCLVEVPSLSRRRGRNAVEMRRRLKRRWAFSRFRLVKVLEDLRTEPL